MNRRQPKRAPRTATRIDAKLLREWPLPEVGDHADKSKRGDVLVVGGSAEIPGAMLLSGVAALRAGAGRVRIASARSAQAALAVAFPEARVLGLPQTRGGELAPTILSTLAPELAGCDALLIGPGMRDHVPAERLVAALHQHQFKGTLILDAAALRALRSPRFRHNQLGKIIATPHAGEMADLCDCERSRVEAAPCELAQEVAGALGVVLILKGAETFVASGTRVLSNRAGNSGLATAGSGDVLAGLIAGLAARGADPLQAAAWGVHLHAKAGETLKRKRGPLGYLARELLDEVPGLLARFDS
ncbi:MAG: NAD(P)H-hydrate dehydratase [Myxococcota bacterium]